MLKNKKMLIVIISLIAILSIASISYAYYQVVSEQDEANTASSACFKLSYHDSNDITLLKSSPLSEEETASLTPYTFTIKNICQMDAAYDVRIEILNETDMNINAVRYKLDNNVSKILGSEISAEDIIYDDAKDSKIIANGSLSANEEVSYDLKLWIDENATLEDAAEKIFSSKIVVTAKRDLKTFYAIEFHPNNGEDVFEIQVDKGSTLIDVDDEFRDKEGHLFAGWYSDEELTSEYDYSLETVPTSDMVLYARWVNPDDYAAGLYDEHFNLEYTWQEIFDNGFANNDDGVFWRDNYGDTFLKNYRGNFILGDDIYKLGKESFYDISGTAMLNNMISLVIPDNVTTLGWVPFLGLSNLRTINIGTGLNSFSAQMFNSDYKLKQFNIDENNEYYASEGPALYSKDKTILYAYPSAKGDVVVKDGVKTIWGSVFDSASTRKIKSVVLPDSLETLYTFAFSGQNELESITFGNGLKYVGSAAFSNCTKLTEINLPDSVETMESMAFKGCTGLTSVTLPASLKKIDKQIFQDCTNLHTVNLPTNVEEIIGSAFSGDYNLTNINLDSNNQYFSIENSIIYNKNQTELVAYPSASGNVVIKDGVKTIKTLAMRATTKVNSVTLPDSVETLELSAFYGSTLSTINLGSGIKTIGSYSLSSLSNLTSITIPASVTTIDSYAFDQTPLVNATFEDKNGWMANTTSISATDLENTATAATYLKKTYRASSWTKS